jgi:hypothetical protein
VTDGGAAGDGAPAVDVIDAVDANVTRDASLGDASPPDLARPDVGTDTGATVDAGGEPALASPSGCLCVVSATSPAANPGQGTAALLLFVGAACLRRRQRRRGAQDGDAW